MATVFRRASSDCWIACYRVYDAQKGAWVWRQKGLGTTDKGKATAMAVALEGGAAEAKAGRMTRARALALVNDILKISGLDAVTESPSLAEMTAKLLAEKDVSEGTARKYAAQWKSFREWAGEMITRPVDAWTASELDDYYRAMRAKHSATTANDHMRFVTGLFERAVAYGYRTGNPAEAVNRVSSDIVEKRTFNRSQIARLLRAMRRARRRDWIALTGLGWHTGHRLQDLLDVVPSRIQHNADVGWTVELHPRKKGGLKNSGDDGMASKGRIVVLPIPAWVARMVRKLGGFKTIENADNRNGRVSDQFVNWLRTTGIDPLPVKRGSRTVHLLSFHSLRHTMASRLTAAGVSGELARLVTDHSSPKVQRKYIHAEISALRVALAAVRRR